MLAVLISGVFSSSFAFAQVGPIAKDDSYSVDEDSLLTVDSIGVLLNDTDTQSGIFLAVILTSTGFGTLDLNSDGSLTYQPNPDFDSTDSFTYVTNDGTQNSNEATVTISVIPINDPPSALDNSYIISEDTVLNIPTPGVLGNDSDVDGDTLTSIIDTTTSSGVLALNSDGSFTYTPTTNSNDSDSFTYHANDGFLDSNIVTVDITITPENDAPIARDDLAETQQNVPIRIDVLENDSDTEDDSLNIILTIDPSETKGLVELENSKVLFTPIVDFAGETTFSYVVSDGDKTSNSAKVTVTVTDEDPNDKPILDQILEQIESLLNKVTNLESEITELKEENSDLAMRIIELESIVENGVPTDDDNKDDNEDDNEKVTVCHKGKNTISISENALSAHLKHGDSVGECDNNNDNETSKKAIENQIKALKNDFKAQEKELKNQLKDLKKDKKSHDDDEDDD